MLQYLFTTEGVLFSGLSAMLVATHSQKKHYHRVYAFFLLTLILTSITIISDKETDLIIIIAQFLGVFFTFLSGYFIRRDHIEEKQETLMLMLVGLIGLVTLVKARNLLTIYMGLELVSFPLYTLVALGSQTYRTEAALKYFIQGSFASALYLFALSLLFGMYGVEGLNMMDRASLMHHEFGVLSGSFFYLESFSLGLILATMSFKLSLAPFHFWVSDVYSRAQSSFLLYLSVVPKIAFFTLALNLISMWLSVELQHSFLYPLMFITALSALWSQTAALSSHNLGHVLGYSSIGQMSFLGLLLLLPADYEQTLNIGLFHLMAYGLASSLIFGILTLMNKPTSLSVESLKGFYYQEPKLALILSLALFSLAGIPPLPGFFGKFFILEAAVSEGYTYLSLFLLLSSVMACGYYVKLIALIFDKKPQEPLQQSAEYYEEVQVNQLDSATYTFISLIFSGLIVLAFNPGFLLI